MKMHGICYFCTKMKQLILIVGLLCAVLPSGGRTMKDLFKEMPDSIVPLLTREDRLDCIDFLESGMKANVKNRFGELSSLQALTATYAAIDLTASSRMEMRMMPDGRDTLVCVVHTWLTPIPMSDIAFYSSAWQPLDAKKYLKWPQIRDFIRKDADYKAADDILQRTGVALLSASLSAEDDRLTFSLQMDGNNPELKRDLMPYVNEKLSYRWQNGHFVP